MGDMRAVRGFAGLLVAGLVLSGCGGGGAGSGGGGGGLLTEEERILAFGDMSGQLNGLFNTGYTGQPGEVPSSGDATFTGYAAIVLDTTPEELGLLGDATVQIDFGTQVLTGQVVDIFGTSGSGFADYAGTIGLQNGEVGYDTPRGDTVPNDIRFRYVGSLSGDGNTILLDGDAAGKLKGTPIQGLVAQNLPGDTSLVNLVPVGTTFVLVARID